MFERLSDDAMLPRNRVQAKRWLRRKRQVAIGGIPVLLAVIFLTPTEFVGNAWVVAFGIYLVLMGACEVKRVLIFRQDLVDRRTS